MFAHTAASDTISDLLFSFLLRYDARGNYVPEFGAPSAELENGGISSATARRIVAARPARRALGGRRAADRRRLRSSPGAPLRNRQTTLKRDRLGRRSIRSTCPTRIPIVIRLKRPNIAVLGILAMGGAAYPPLPAHLLAKLPEPQRRCVQRAAAFERTVPAQSNGITVRRSIFVPNPRYCRGPPKLKEVVWKIVPDAEHALQRARHPRDRRVSTTSPKRGSPRLAELRRDPSRSDA